MVLYEICFAVALALPIGVAVLVALDHVVTSNNLNPQGHPSLYGQRAVLFAVAVMAGLFVLMLPFFFTGDYPVLTALLNEFYHMLSVVFANTDAREWADTVYDAMGVGAFPLAYATLLQLYLVLTPILFVGTVFSVLLSFVPFWRVKIAQLVHRHDDVFVFSGLDERIATLAIDILRHESGKRCLLVFCNMSKRDRDAMGTMVKALADAGGRSAIYIPQSIDSLRLGLAGFGSVRFFVVSADTTWNVDAALRLLRAMPRRVAMEVSGAMQIPSDANGGDFTSEQQKVLDEVRALARRVAVYCSHDGDEDELLFDSLAHAGSGAAAEGSTDDGVHMHGCSDAIPRAVVQAVCDSVQVRLFSEVEEHVRDLFARKPLYEALGRRGRPGENRLLTVVVIGLGETGIAGLMRVFWLGRMPDVTLKIIAVGLEANEVERKLSLSRPAMVSERVAEQRWAGDYGFSPDERTISFVEQDVHEPGLDQVLESIRPQSHVYTLVALGNDEGNLATALHVLRFFDEKAAAGKGVPTRLPSIAFRMRKPEIRTAAEHLVSDRSERFSLTPFGDANCAYSFDNMIASPWERMAINVAAGYSGCLKPALFMGDGGESTEETAGVDEPDGASSYEAVAGVRFEGVALDFAEALRDFNAYEIKKASNRSSAQHIGYRLWALGFELLDVNDFVAGEPIPGATAEVERGGWRRSYRICGREEWLSAMFPDGADAMVYLSPLDASDLEGGYRRLYSLCPKAMELADVEHERWAAFYRAQGWRGASPDEMRRLVAITAEDAVSAGKKRLLGGEKGLPQQSPKLRRHVFICSCDELARVGAVFGEDVSLYDRILVALSARVLEGSVVKGFDGKVMSPRFVMGKELFRERAE